MRGVIHIDEVSQVAVVVDKRPFRVSRPLVPEDIDITEAVPGPDIELGPVPRRCSQGLPFACMKHGFTFQSNGAVFRRPPPLSISLHGLGHSLYGSETGARLRSMSLTNAIPNHPAFVGRPGISLDPGGGTRSSGSGSPTSRAFIRALVHRRIQLGSALSGGALTGAREARIRPCSPWSGAPNLASTQRS